MRAFAALVLVFALTACSAPAVTDPDGASPGSPSEPSSTQDPAPALKEACTEAVPHIRKALKALSDSVDDGADPEAFQAMGEVLASDATLSPSVLATDLNSMALVMGAAYAGGTLQSEDLTTPGNRALATCGETEEPVPTPSEEESTAPSTPSYSRAEQKYLDREATDDDDQDKVLADGRKDCRKIGEHDRGYSRNRYLVDHNFKSAINYLCAKYKGDLKASDRAIYEGDYEVGHDVKTGTYRTEPGASECYWERQTGGGRIIANDFITHAAKGVTVTIYSSDGGFSTHGCGPWIPIGRRSRTSRTGRRHRPRSGVSPGRL